MNMKISTIFSLLLVSLWLILIFFLSSQPATQSNQSSLRVTEMIVTTVAKVIVPEIGTQQLEQIVYQFNNLVRKLAHGGLFFVLGILLVCALVKMGIKDPKTYFLAFLFCLLYSGSDELHQLFVPGRSGQLTDIVIDVSGAAVGIGIYWLYWRKKNHKRKEGFGG